MTLDAVTAATDSVTMTTGFYTSVVVTDASNPSPVPPEITLTDAFSLSTSFVTIATSTTPSTIATSETTFFASTASTSIQKPASPTLDAVSPVATNNAETVVTNGVDATTADGKAPDIDAVAPATEVPVTTVTNGNAATTNAPANDAVASIDLITSATNTAAIPATNAVANTTEAFTQTKEESDEIKASPDGPGEVVKDVVTDSRTITTTVVRPTSYPALPTNSPSIGPEAAVPISSITTSVPAAAPQPELDVKTDSKPSSGVEEKSEGLSAEREAKKTPTNSENKDKAAEAPGITTFFFSHCQGI